MTEQTIFNSADDSDQNDDGNPPAPQVPAAVADLVGPGKKYATVEKALEALAHAQTHIQKIEGENAEYRTKVEGAVSKEEVYSTVQELLKAERATPSPAVVDEAALAAVLDRQLTAREAAATARHNTEVVKNVMVDKFADKAEEIYKLRAKELGLSMVELNTLVGKSPVAALKLLGIDDVKRTTAPSRGSINTDALQATNHEPTPLPTVMRGATHQQMLAKWHEAKPKT